MLTTAQLQAVKAEILADPVLAAFPQTPDGAYEIANRLNLEAAPAFYVWRSAYTPEQMRAAIANGITQLDGLTASKRDSLLWFTEGTVDCSKVSTQAALDDLCGSQNTLKAALKDGGKRSARRIEKLFATGTGTFAAPASAVFEGTISYQEVEAARAL